MVRMTAADRRRSAVTSAPDRYRFASQVMRNAFTDSQKVNGHWRDKADLLTSFLKPHIAGRARELSGRSVTVY